MGEIIVKGHQGHAVFIHIQQALYKLDWDPVEKVQATIRFILD